MKTNTIAPRYKGYRFPPEIISYGGWFGPVDETAVKRLKAKACQTRDEGENLVTALPLCEDEQVNTPDCTRTLGNRQGERCHEVLS